MSRPAFVLAAALAFAPAFARAESTPCWYERGVLVVPASVVGVAGDYILDTGAPATLLHETRAEAAGFETKALRGEVRVAGLRLDDRPVAVADLDARTAAFPTPIAGVIGADVLAGRVLDIDFAACRVAIYRADAAPRFAADGRLPFDPARPLPAVRAAVADGPRALQGPFVLATGLDAAVRLDGALASAPGAAGPDVLPPDGAARASLRALSLGGELFENLPAGLLAPTPAGPVGVIGAPVLERWRVRFDFARHALLLAKKKSPPDRSSGP